jgi:hypothetical protein
MNNTDNLKTTKLAKRITEHRNAFAHGNIDKEIDYNISLDSLVLEWLYYTMYFKKMDISSVNIKKIINKLFSLNQFFE